MASMMTKQAKTYSPSEFDLHLMRLASAYHCSESAKGRQLIKGRTQRAIWSYYKTEETREAVWSEWEKLAGVRH